MTLIVAVDPNNVSASHKPGYAISVDGCNLSNHRFITQHSYMGILCSNVIHEVMFELVNSSHNPLKVAKMCRQIMYSYHECV